MQPDLTNNAMPGRFFGVYVLALMLVVFSSHVNIPNSKPGAEKKGMCSIEFEQPTSIIDVSEMLFAIKGFTLSDTEELP